MSETKCLFHITGNRHDSCVTARQFGRIWLVNDGQTLYWVGARAIAAAHKFAVQDDDENYSRWCNANPSPVSGFGGDGTYGITDRGSVRFLRACRAMEQKIDVAGGIEYAALVECA